MPEPITIYDRPTEILQNLLRYDTTNPPGNETACVKYIASLLDAVGIENQILAKEENRANLVARIKGDGNASPLLLYGHVDVVTTDNQQWTHPPFNGDIVDGMVWGRGALDMKGGIAMMLSAFMRAKVENTSLPGDVILCVVSDEEVGGINGAGFLAEQHPELFEGVRYAIGEVGGFSMQLGGKTFYPIQLAEKHPCRVTVTVSGPAGHGSVPLRSPQAATYKLAKILETLNTQRLPVHITPIARDMIETMANHLDLPLSDMMRQMLDPQQTDSILDQLGEQGRMLDSMLHNTVSPNILSGGNKINVIPASVSVQLDGRLLPDQTCEDLYRELYALLGTDIEIETFYYGTPSTGSDTGLYDTLASTLKAVAPDVIPVPFMLPAGTDARFFSKLGIQTYGFLPTPLPEDWNFLGMLHAADERIPIDALEFGARVLFKTIAALRNQ